MQSEIARGVQPVLGPVDQNNQILMGTVRSLTFHEALQDIVTFKHRAQLTVAKNMKISHDDVRVHTPVTLRCRCQVANLVFDNIQWRTDKDRVGKALDTWDEICRLDTSVTLASLNNRRMARAIKAAKALRDHPYTQVRDTYEISYDMWLAVAQYQHLKIVERELHLSPETPRRVTKDLVLSRNMKEPIAGLKLKRLVDLRYPKHLKDLENQLYSLKKLLKHKASSRKGPGEQQALEEEPTMFSFPTHY